MYPVSTAFQEAIRQPRRKTRISLMLVVWYPYAVYEFGDEAVISDSLTITDQFSGGKFCFGSVYSRNLSVQIDANKVPDLDPINVNLTDAVISATFYLTLPSGEEEAVFLGRFFADGNMTKRKKSILSINASDSLMKLDLPVSEQNNKTVYNIAHDILWGDASRNLKNSESEIAALPNGKQALTLAAGQIQTVRDALMWIGELTGTFIREDRSGGSAGVEFVQIPTKYTKAGTDWNFDLDTFKADNGSIIPADVRFNTDFTDTSIRPITYLTRRNGTAFVSVNDSWTAAPDTLFGSYEFDTNPLLAAKTDGQMQAIMDNIRNYADNLRFCPFNVKFNGNPAIQCGDYVYLEPGGGIDETQYRHYGIVTYYKWKYRGASEIRCATDIAGERPSSGYEEAQSISIMSAEPRVAAATETEQYSLKAKSQLEKRLDGIGDTCTALVSSVQKPQFALKLKTYTLELYDPGGTKVSEVSLYPGNLIYKSQQPGKPETSVNISKDACYIWFGGAMYNLYPNGFTFNFNMASGTDNVVRFDGKNLYIGNKRVITTD